MREIFQSKIMIGFIIFVIIFTFVFPPQKNDSSVNTTMTSQIENLNK